MEGPSYTVRGSCVDEGTWVTCYYWIYSGEVYHSSDFDKIPLVMVDLEFFNGYDVAAYKVEKVKLNEYIERA